MRNLLISDIEKPRDDLREGEGNLVLHAPRKSTVTQLVINMLKGSQPFPFVTPLECGFAIEAREHNVTDGIPLEGDP